MFQGIYSACTHKVLEIPKENKMYASNYDPDTLTRAFRAAAEAFLATLDEEAGNTPKPTTRQGDAGGLIDYDPLHDEPPFEPNPKEGAGDAQNWMASVAYLGAIGRFYSELGRGARAAEVSEFAKRARYSGGNAVNGWNSRKDSPRAIEMINGERLLNHEALAWIKKDAAKLGLRLVGEFKTVPRQSE